MATLILTVVIVLAVVCAIAVLSPERDTDAALLNSTPPTRIPEGIVDEEEDALDLPRHPSFHLDWVDAAASGKMFNLTGNDDEPGFYF